MLRRLATILTPTRRSDERRAAARIPDGLRVYAIGDIHGRSDLLAGLLKQIEADTVDYNGRVILVGIGDYIDRGPNSKGVVQLLMDDVHSGWEKVFLRGNHEQAMMDFMAEPGVRGEWLAWGGIQALESYGVPPFGARGLRDGAAMAAEFDMALEETGHKAFYDATQLSHIVGDYMFVHAGVRSGIAADKQMAEDLLFIREDFFDRPHGLPYRIVFGHTILGEALIEDDRIGLDTGAFQSGILTAVRLEGDEALIIQQKSV